MSLSDFDFYTGLADELDLSSDYFWEDFGQLIDNELEDRSAVASQDPHHRSVITPEDLAEQPDLFRRIHSPSLPARREEPLNGRQQTNMPNGRYESPSTPRRHGFYDLEYSDDPFRPLSSHANHPVIDLTDSSPLQMPKRKLSGAAATAHAAKKQRISLGQSAVSQSRESAEPPKTKYETVDLTLDSVEEWKTTRERREKEALEAQRAKESAQKRPKLAEFECVICLENPTDLVVTHCGHLFCSECLHNALDSGPGGSKCPSCRSKIVMRASNTKENKITYYPLEIQLKVSTKSGKRKA